jgi:hypothetical protein
MILLLNFFSYCSVDNTWIKGYLRLGTCYQRLQRWHDAVTTYRQALEIQPSNDEIKRLLRDCENRVSDQFRGNRRSDYQSQQGASYGSTAGFNPTSSWQVIASNVWNQLKIISQQGMIHAMRFYHSLSSEMKIAYGIGIAMICYYIYSSLFSSHRYYDDYAYYGGYGYGGGLSTMSLILIMAAGTFYNDILYSYGHLSPENW